MARNRSALCAILSVAVVIGCATQPPRLAYDRVALPADGGFLDYAIYLPPEFRREERLPLIVFLHGAGDSADCFDEAGVGDALDQAIQAGEIPRAVIAVPSGGLSFWENWVDGTYSYRDWVLRSLVPEVRQRYGTADCPDGCHLMGISMGGHGALRFLLFEPGIFSTVTAISAPILDTDTALEMANESWFRFIVPTSRIWGPGTRESVEAEDMFLRWTRPEDLAGTRLTLAWATQDHRQIVESNERFDRHLEESGIEHGRLVFPGRHNWKAWTPALVQLIAAQLPADAPAAVQVSDAAQAK